MIGAASSGWWTGLVLGCAVAVVVVVLVAVVLTTAARVADSARIASTALPVARDRMAGFRDAGAITESAISILRSARAVRKALTGT